MQDKQIHIAKKLTDRGWGEMSKLLDREMPAPAKERRRFGWWWLALGLSVGLASGVFAVKYFTQTEKPPVDANIPVAVAPDAADETALMKNEAAKIAAENIVAETQVAPVEKSPVVSAVSSKKSTPKSPAIVEEKANFQVVKPSPSTVFEKTQPVVSPNETQAVAGMSTIGETPNPGNGRVSAGEKIALASLNPLPIPDGDTPEVPSELPLIRNGKWAVYGSGLASWDANSSGLAAGLMKSSALKNSKFSLEGGVGYAYLQQPLSVIFTAEEGAISTSSTFTNFNTVLGDTKIANRSNAYSNAARLLKKLQLHYLEVPLAANYQLTPRFSVRAGVNAAILLSSSSDYTTGGVFNKGLNPSGLMQDEVEASFDYNGEQPSVELNHFDLSATTGFDYRINTCLAAGFGYQFGLVDLIPGNDAGDFNRLFRVTLRYNLTQRK